MDYPSSWRAIGDCVWLSKTLWVKISLKSQMVSFAREESETSTRYGLESYERSYVERIKKYPLSVSPGAQNMSSSTKLFNTWNLKSLKQLLEQSTLFYNSENMMVWFKPMKLKVNYPLKKITPLFLNAKESCDWVFSEASPQLGGFLRENSVLNMNMTIGLTL